jgi:hypothetical protein
MSSNHRARALLLSASIALVGCLAPVDDEVGVNDAIGVPYETMEGPYGNNGLNPVDFWSLSNQQALRALGAGALNNSSGALVSTSLLGTAGGRSVLSYTIRCALPGSASVQAADGSVFYGDLGFAPDWSTRALTTSEQRWMTACLLQHLNGLGQHVTMLLQGSHSALDPNPGEDYSDYAIGDITTFGNVFEQNLLGYKAWACVDPILDLSCGVGLSTITLERLCGLSPTCGINILGPCALYCSYSASGDPSCTPLLGSTYTQSIASKLEESAFISLYPLCLLPP